ncbi:MAG: hypothetical protein KQH83_06685 [Actinobacteria bacterium]|nr:hypothetical protein [Actinomycetota bacterium]
MIQRLASAVLAAALVVAGCAYETVGTTTTTVLDPDQVPPATGPADLVFRDQLTDGGSVTLDSVTLPSPGFVVLFDDRDGAPGDAIGATRILSAGTIANVPVSFYVPITESAVVHARVHVDMDRDEAFTYEPPDAFVDVPATHASGEVAEATATISLLAPLSPAVVGFAEQRTTGETVEVLSAELPADGFVVIREDDQGEAGRIVGRSGLLPSGIHENLVITLDDPLEISAVLFASIYIDRDGDGALFLGAGAVDALGQGLDGLEATIGVPVTAVPLEPVTLVSGDQESENGDEVLATVTLPAPGFLVLQADDGGRPGAVVAVSSPLAIGTTDVVFTLEEPITGDTTFWLTVHIDFDGAGEFDDGDPVGILGEGGEAQTSILLTLPVPEDDADA